MTAVSNPKAPIYPTNTNSLKMSPMLRPQSLLLYPDVLARASISESLRQRAQNGATSTGTVHPLLQNNMVFTNYQQQQDHEKTLYAQRLQQQLLQLQEIKSQAIAPSEKKDIIGMGICVPNPLTAANATTRTNALTHRKTPAQSSSSVKKMMLFGKPLRAPPPLARHIVKKRPAALVRAASVTMHATAQDSKRRKLDSTLAPRRVSLGDEEDVTPPPATSKKVLSSEELEFVEAAQRLHDVPSLSPLPSPKPLSPKTHLKALQPPPALRF